MKNRPIVQSEIDPEKIEKIFRKTNFTTSSCWLSEFNTCNRGYAQIGIEKKTYFLHRYMYVFFRGQIPDGLTIDHLCRTRHCINPWHMEVVTNQENNARKPKIYKPRKNKAEFCQRGHVFDEQNTGWATNYRVGRPRRYCKTCHYQNCRKNLLAKKAS